MKLSYHAKAREEVIEATSYYNDQRAGLGAEFLTQLTIAIDAILASPDAFEQVRPRIRRCLLRRFPYGVYYRTPDENTVRIIAVRHHSRHPGLGMRRT